MNLSGPAVQMCVVAFYCVHGVCPPSPSSLCSVTTCPSSASDFSVPFRPKTQKFVRQLDASSPSSVTKYTPIVYHIEMSCRFSFRLGFLSFCCKRKMSTTMPQWDMEKTASLRYAFFMSTQYNGAYKCRPPPRPPTLLSPPIFSALSSLSFIRPNTASKAAATATAVLIVFVVWNCDR